MLVSELIYVSKRGPRCLSLFQIWSGILTSLINHVNVNQRCLNCCLVSLNYCWCSVTHELLHSIFNDTNAIIYPLFFICCDLVLKQGSFNHRHFWSTFTFLWSNLLTHWGRVTHICVSKLTIIGWDNGLSPGRRQAIIWTHAGTLLIRTPGTNFSEILSEMHAFSFKKMHLEMPSGNCPPFCLGLNVLTIIVEPALCWLHDCYHWHVKC